MSAATNPKEPTPPGAGQFPPVEDSEDPGERRLRADAARNRDRVISAATEAFASEGIDVPMEVIAKRAGVGVATIYRQFPTKESLFAAIVQKEMYGMVEFARELANAELANAEDAGTALHEFISRVIETVASKRDLAEALEDSGAKSRSPELQALWRATLAPLVERATKAGAIRSDVDVDEVLLLVSGACSAVMNHGPDERSRALLARVIFDGLRPEQMR
jgi:AcrR family transcriptional regulator